MDPLNLLITHLAVGVGIFLFGLLAAWIIEDSEEKIKFIIGVLMIALIFPLIIVTWITKILIGILFGIFVGIAITFKRK